MCIRDYYLNGDDNKMAFIAMANEDRSAFEKYIEPEYLAFNVDTGKAYDLRTLPMFNTVTGRQRSPSASPVRILGKPIPGSKHLKKGLRKMAKKHAEQQARLESEGNLKADYTY